MVRRPVGRPPIGPHMQTRVPLEDARWIMKEAEERGTEIRDMLREVIAAGVSTLRGES